MFDITKELDKIIDKYSLDDVYPEYRNTVLARELVLRYANECKGKRVLCVTTSPHESTRFRRDCDGLIGEDFVWVPASLNNDKSFEGFLELSVLDDIQFEKYDFVLIISFYGEAFLKRYFRMHGIVHESIYDYFEINNVYIEREYYYFFDDKCYDTLVESYARKYKSVCSIFPYERFRLRQEYRATNNKDYKVLCLKRSFFMALLERDFVGLKDIWDSFKEYDSDLERFKKAYDEIQILLKDIKRFIQERKENAIIALWIDAISYSEAQEWTYLKSIKNTGVWFDNMHTVTPYTSQTMRAIMCEKLPVDDDSMSITNIDSVNSPLISSLESRGYSFKSFDGDFVQINKKYRSEELCEIYTAFSMRNWEMLREMCLNDKAQFFLVHELIETHMPFINYMVNDEAVSQSQYRKQFGMIAVEKQLEFLDEMIGDKYIKIIFSDHGNSNFTTRFHTFFSVLGKDLPNKVINGLVSLVSFRRIVEMLIDTIDIDKNEIEKKELTIQDVPYYNGRAIAAMIDFGYIHSDNVGYRGIVDKDYYYACFSNGMQWACSRKEGRPKMNPNLLFDMAEDESILKEYRRKLDGKIFPSVGEDSGRYTKYIGLALNDEKTLICKNKKIELVTNLIHALPEKNVAIRTGGVHSYTFLGIILKMGMIKKVNWIIDINKNCACKDFDIPIVSPDDAKTLDISAVIKGYFDLDEALKNEYEAYRKRDIEVVDVYEVLAKEGINVKQDYNFYDMQLECDTYSLGFPRAEVGM